MYKAYEFVWPKQFVGRDQARRERAVINEDPTLSLHIYRQLKKRDVFNFGVTRSALARAVDEYKRNPRKLIAAIH